jgi:hypothetical protein
VRSRPGCSKGANFHRNRPATLARTNSARRDQTVGTKAVLCVPARAMTRSPFRRCPLQSEQEMQRAPDAHRSITRTGQAPGRRQKSRGQAFRDAGVATPFEGRSPAGLSRVAIDIVDSRPPAARGRLHIVPARAALRAVCTGIDIAAACAGGAGARRAAAGGAGGGATRTTAARRSRSGTRRGTIEITDGPSLSQLPARAKVPLRLVTAA